MSKTVARARSLRHNQTPAEKRIWEHLRNSNLGVKFRRQLSIGPYIADFVCLDLKLIVEIDGADHAGNERDDVRTAHLEGLGYKIVRYWNNDVLKNTAGVLQDMSAVIDKMKT